MTNFEEQTLKLGEMYCKCILIKHFEHIFSIDICRKWYWNQTFHEKSDWSGWFHEKNHDVFGGDQHAKTFHEEQNGLGWEKNLIRNV